MARLHACTPEKGGVGGLLLLHKARESRLVSKGGVDRLLRGAYDSIRQEATMQGVSLILAPRIPLIHLPPTRSYVFPNITSSRESDGKERRDSILENSERLIH